MPNLGYGRSKGYCTFPRNYCRSTIPVIGAEKRLSELLGMFPGAPGFSKTLQHETVQLKDKEKFILIRLFIGKKFLKQFWNF